MSCYFFFLFGNIELGESDEIEAFFINMNRMDLVSTESNVVSRDFTQKKIVIQFNFKCRVLV